MSIHDDPPRDDTDNARCECGRFIPCRHCPTPIDPADIRPGDVWEMRRQITVQTVSLDDPELFWDAFGNPWRRREGWYLVHRPDPDADAVQAIRSASYNIHHAGERMDPLPGLPEATDLLTKLREQGWDVTRRQS